MTSLNNFISPDLRGLSEQKLLAFYDNPKNFDIKDTRQEKYNKNFPENSLVLLTHGTYAVNYHIRRALDETTNSVMRLLKNFSDFGTKRAVDKSGIPKDSIIYNKGSRLIGDANRSVYADDFLRETDFSGNRLLDTPENFQEDGADITSDYHLEIEENAIHREKAYGGVIAFDIHDTGVRLMDKNPQLDTFRKGGFPFITLGTKDGASCNIEILYFFAERLNKYLGIKPMLNNPYKGGFVTTAHGEEYRKQHKTKKRNVIQVEIGRFLYMKESTQEVDKERMEIIGVGLRKAITDTGIKFGEEYFKGLDV